MHTDVSGISPLMKRRATLTLMLTLYSRVLVLHHLSHRRIHWGEWFPDIVNAPAGAGEFGSIEP